MRVLLFERLDFHLKILILVAQSMCLGVLLPLILMHAHDFPECSFESVIILSHFSHPVNKLLLKRPLRRLLSDSFLE